MILQLRLIHWFLTLTILFWLSLTVLAAAQTPVDGFWDNRFGAPAHGGNGLFAEVLAFAVHPITGEVYAGGQFTFAGGVQARYIAKWTGSAWQPLGGGFNGQVRGLAFDANGNLYAGGVFTIVQQTDGSAVDAAYVARWDGTSWTTLGQGLDGRVAAIAVDPSTGDVYVGGGGFDKGTNADSSEVLSPSIIKWNGQTWQPVGLGLPPAFGHDIETIAISPTNGDVYIGGRHLSRVLNADSTEVIADGLAHWDGSTWSPLGDPGTASVLAFDDNGVLYVGGDFTNIGGISVRGLARWDGTTWEAVGGGLGNGKANAIAFSGAEIYVGGTFIKVLNTDGTEIAANLIAKWDAGAGNWSALGAGAYNPNFQSVNAIAIQVTDVFVGGNFTEAGALPALYFSRWIAQPPSFTAAYVTFGVDMRRLQRFGLFRKDHSRPTLEVFSGANAGPYFLYDADEDTVWTVQIPQPVGENVGYAFALDDSRDGYNVDNDWIYELDGSAGARSLTLSSTDPVTLPVVTFDDLPVEAVDPDYRDQVRQRFQPGDPPPVMFSISIFETHVSLDFERLDRASFVAVRWYTKDPGGNAPAGIAVVASNTYWGIEMAPAAADFSGRLTFNYEAITGIENPEDLRVLHRSGPTQPWQVLESEVDLNAQTITAVSVTSMSEWTLASISTDNPLTAEPPGLVSKPNPGDGILNAPIRPLFAWQPAKFAQTYDLYLWRADETEPANPTRRGLQEASYKLHFDLIHDVEYNWRLVALNINGSTPGPVWSFWVGKVPDLQVTAIQTPQQAFSGQLAEISWTVTNTGDGGTNVPVWFDEIYLSQAPVFDHTNATSLGRFRNLSSLNPTESYANSATFTLPEGVQGGQYVYVFTDAPERLQGLQPEIDENNNVSRSDLFTITLTPYADLQVTSVIAPDNAFSGDSIQVSWTVENLGTGSTGIDRWADAIFLSENDTLEFNFTFTEGIIRIIEDREIAASEHTGVLAVNETYIASTRIKLPDDAIGDYYLFVYTDVKGKSVKKEVRGNVYEYTQELNNWRADPIRITLTPPPDLVVTEVKPPATSTSGETIVLEWTVQNQGPGATRAELWSDLVYFSTTAQFDSASAQALGSFTHRGIVKNDSSYTATGGVRIPDGVSGNVYFFVHTDWASRIFEHTFETNNLQRNTQLTEVTLAPYPDVQVSELTVTPATATAGQQVAIRYEVRNAGSADAGSWTDSVYVSQSDAWDAQAALPIAGIEHTIPLPVGSARTPVTAVTLPAGIEGTYYLYVKADARDDLFEYPDQENNIVRSAALTVEAYPPVDLAIQIDHFPQQANSGQAIPLQLTIENLGEGKTLSSLWVDAVYLSLDETLEVDQDVQLAVLIHEGALAGNASYRYDRSIKLPNGLAGSYYLIAQTDIEQKVNEANEENNVAVSAQPVMVTLTTPSDLRVTQLDAPAAVQAAQPVTVFWSVENTGDGATDGDRWFDALYLSRDATLDKSDLLLATREHGLPLAANSSYRDSLRVKLPSYSSGAYYLMVQTDSRDDIYEHLAEGDNITRVRIDFTLPSPSDLTVTNVTVPAQATPGEEITVSWTIRNVGNNPAVGVMREAVFVSENEAWDTDDPVLGVVEREIDLAPGETTLVMMKVNLARTFRADHQGNITEEMPGVLPGSYHAVVRTDIANNIRETDDRNNTLASSSTIDAEVAELQLEAPETVTLAAGRSRYYRLDMEAGRDLRLTLTSDVGDAANELYVAFDRPPTAGGDFDFAAAEPFTADQQMIIPSTQAGTYYLLVTARRLPGNTQTEILTLTAEALDFSITAISPNIGGQGQVTTTIRGAGFRESSRFFLQDSHGTEIEGETVEFVSTTEVKVRWRLRNADLGVYDLVVEIIGGEATKRSQAFTVEEANDLDIAIDATAPNVIRAEGSATYTFFFTNTANVDIPYFQVRFISPAVTKLSKIETSEDLLKQVDIYGDSVGALVTENFRVIDPNTGEESRVVELISMHVPPGKKLKAILQFSGFTQREFPLFFTSNLQTVTGYIHEQIDTIERLRTSVLDKPSEYDPALVVFAANRIAFRDTLLKYAYIVPGLIDTKDISEHNDLLANETTTLAKSTGPQTNLKTQKFSLYPLHLALNDSGPEPNGPGGGCEKPFWDQDRCKLYSGLVCTGAFAVACLPTGPYGTIACALFGAGVCYELIRSGTNNGKICRPVKKACDPNDIIGPEGFGEKNWLIKMQTLPYTIRFENDPELATAPAQVVEIRHPLAPTVDVRSFRLGSFGFGPFTFDPPQNVSYYTGRLDVTDSLGVYVDVTAGIDVIANEAFWVFTSIDPETGDQPLNDPFAGFLPVNDTTGVGEGFVSYTIRADEATESGDIIDAEASIIFDINAPIDTPPIFNTIDANAPTSTAMVLPGRLDTTAFEITWTGEDVGSGIRDFALYVAADEEPFELYQAGLTDGSLLFIGKPERRYRFFTIATDNVGNTEPMKSKEDAVVDVHEDDSQDAWLPERFALFHNYPNPFNPSTTVVFDIARAGEVELRVYNVLGQRVLNLKKGTMQPGRYQQLLDMSRFASGVYFYELRVHSQHGLIFRNTKKLLLVK